MEKKLFKPNKKGEYKPNPEEIRFLNEEITETLEQETPEELYEKIQAEMDFVLKRYFPEEFEMYQGFKKPLFSEILHSFHDSKIRIGRKNSSNETPKINYEDAKVSRKERAGFIAATLIRYIDNFIDEQLWPQLHKYNKEYIKKEFDSFITEALIFVRRFDPGMPDSIARLVQLEIDLELEPTQENFDNKCVDLLTQKSYDMFYVSSLLGLTPKKDIDQLSNREQIEYEAVACADYARDFTDSHIKEDTDLNLARLIADNELNPVVLIKYLDDLEQDWHFENPDAMDYTSLEKITDLKNQLEYYLK